MPEPWFDEAAGPLVRPYAVTRGRTRAGQSDLQVITLVVAVRPVTRELEATLEPEHLLILGRCRRPATVAEISVGLELPTGVVKILIADLIERRLVVQRSAAAPDLQVLRAVINGIRQL